MSALRSQTVSQPKSLKGRASASTQEAKPQVLKGHWTRSGGADPLARGNPRFILDLEESQDLQFQLDSPISAQLVLCDLYNRVVAQSPLSDPTQPLEFHTNLKAGRYVVVPVTESPKKSGKFTLTLSGTSSRLTLFNGTSHTSGDRIYSTTSPNGLPLLSVLGNWQKSGGQNPESPRNPHYTFNVTRMGAVTLTMESKLDSYLYLLNSTGKVIQQNDDGGDGQNAKITKRLATGSYKVIPATLGANWSGSFSLSVEGPVEELNRYTPKKTSPKQPDHPTLTGTWESSGGQNPASKNNPKFTFRVEKPSPIQVDLMSSIDNYLYLLDSTNKIVAQDDDGGDNSNSRIKQVLQPGVYTAVAGTLAAGMSGSFTLQVQGAISNFQEKSYRTKGSDPLGQETPLSLTSRGSWFNSGGRTAFSPNNPRYSVQVKQKGNLFVDLLSNIDSYLFVLNERNQIIDENDDGGKLGNARIMRQVNPGLYHIVAATAHPGKKGSFTLKVQGMVQNLRSAPAVSAPEAPTSSNTATSQPAFSPEGPQHAPDSDAAEAAYLRALNASSAVSVKGFWQNSAVDANSRNNPRYTFQVNKPGEVIVDLVSKSADTYLYLLGSRRKIIASNDDFGQSTNSRIARDLTTGIYTLVAATSRSGQQGDFEIFVRGAISHLRELTAQPQSPEGPASAPASASSPEPQDPSAETKPSPEPVVPQQPSASQPQASPESLPPAEPMPMGKLNLDELSKRISELETSTQQLSTENQQIEAQMQPAEVSLNQVLENEKKLKTQVDQMQQQLQLWKRLKELEAYQKKLTLEREGLKRRMTEITQKTDASRERSQRLQTELGKLQSQIGTP